MSFIKVAPKGTLLVDYASNYAAGASIIHIDGLEFSTDLIKAGSTFNIVGQSTEYTVSMDALMQANEGDISFTPGLSAGVNNDTRVLFKTDITDKVISRFNLTYPIDYLNLVDEECVNQAEICLVNESMIKSTPLHSAIKNYLVNWLCALVCLDNTEVNNVEGEDKYKIKMDVYNVEVERYRNMLTRDMFLGFSINSGIAGGTVNRSRVQRIFLG